MFITLLALCDSEPNLSPDVAPKKRRRKDSIMRHNGKDGELISKDPVNTSDMRIKATARSIPLEGKKSSSTRKVLTPFGEHYLDEGHLKNKLKTSTSACKKKSADLTTNSENPSHIKAVHFDVSSLIPGTKNFNKQKLIPSKDITYKSKGTREYFDGMYSAPRTKVASSQVGSHSKKFLDCENNIDASARVRHKERDGLGEFSLLNPPVSTYPMPVVVGICFIANLDSYLNWIFNSLCFGFLYCQIILLYTLVTTQIS